MWKTDRDPVSGGERTFFSLCEAPTILYTHFPFKVSTYTPSKFEFEDRHKNFCYQWRTYVRSNISLKCLLVCDCALRKETICLHFTFGVLLVILEE